VFFFYKRINLDWKKEVTKFWISSFARGYCLLNFLMLRCEISCGVNYEYGCESLIDKTLGYSRRGVSMCLSGKNRSAGNARAYLGGSTRYVAAFLLVFCMQSSDIDFLRRFFRLTCGEGVSTFIELLFFAGKLAKLSFIRCCDMGYRLL